MWASSFTSSFGLKKFSSFSFPNIRPWACKKGERCEMKPKWWCQARRILTWGAQHQATCPPPALGGLSSHVPNTQAHLELSLGRSCDDDHPLAGVGTFCRGNLQNGGGV